MSFDPRSIAAFRYAGMRYDEDTAVAEFDFELVPADDAAEPIRFTESVALTAGFAAPALDDAAEARFTAVLVLLGAVLGLSYYKAAAPPRIELAVGGLSDAAVDYLRVLIREGLAEYAYRNDLPGLIEPELVRTAPAGAVPPLRHLEGAPLVPIGGGKDSIITVESLRAAQLDPVEFVVNPNAVHERVADASGFPLVAARRRLDPSLLALNAAGALNGHVPVTAMNSLIAVAQSVRLGLGPVVMSNESSASDPTLHWSLPTGEVAVNHQWSKSLDGELALSAALVGQAGLVDAVFSLLRPFSELRIARGYATTAHIVAYDRAMVSCNRAFRISGATPSWCGDCDKCRFVFLVLAPWMDADRLIGIVGSDLFDDLGQLPGFRDLLGLGAHKPFECVGEEAEASVAVALLTRQPRWAASPVISALVAEAPELAAGDAEAEARLLGEAPAPLLPEPFEGARRALV